MLFDLTNAPMAFQQFMNDIFSNLLDVCIMIYLDDILIYSNNMSKYHQHVKEVLKYLHKAGLYIKAEKCKFHSKLVEYLGYILSPSCCSNHLSQRQMITQAVNLLSWISSRKFTRELNKEPLLH